MAAYFAAAPYEIGPNGGPRRRIGPRVVPKQAPLPPAKAPSPKKAAAKSPGRKAAAKSAAKSPARKAAAKPAPRPPPAPPAKPMAELVPWNYSPQGGMAWTPKYVKHPLGGADIAVAQRGPWVPKQPLPPHKPRERKQSDMPWAYPEDIAKFRAKLEQKPMTPAEATTVLQQMQINTPVGWRVKAVFGGGINSVAFLMTNRSDTQEYVQKLAISDREKTVAARERQHTRNAAALGLKHIMLPARLPEQGPGLMTYHKALGKPMAMWLKEKRTDYAWWKLNGPFLKKGLKRAMKELHQKLRIAHNDLHTENFLYDDATHTLTVIDLGNASAADAPNNYFIDGVYSADAIPLYTKNWAPRFLQRQVWGATLTFADLDAVPMKVFDLGRLHGYLTAITMMETQNPSQLDQTVNVYWTDVKWIGPAARIEFWKPFEDAYEADWAEMGVKDVETAGMGIRAGNRDGYGWSHYAFSGYNICCEFYYSLAYAQAHRSGNSAADAATGKRRFERNIGVYAQASSPIVYTPPPPPPPDPDPDMMAVDRVPPTATGAAADQRWRILGVPLNPFA